MFAFRTTRIAATAAAAIVAAVLVASPAQASQAPAPQPGDNYVALGSSYAAGAGLGPSDPGDINGLCGRTTIAYPQLVASALDLRLVNATCGGATTANITTTPQRVTNFVTGASGTLPPQIDAVTPATDLVTITIGGNDVSYVSELIAQACLGELAANPNSVTGNLVKRFGACTAPSDETVLEALAGLEDNIASVVDAVRTRAPLARIVLVDYLTVLPQNGKPCAAAPIPQDRQKFILAVANQMNLATKHAAQRTGAELVAASKVSWQHDTCSSDPWIQGFAFVSNIMHPNEAGHQAVANAVINQLTSPGNAS